MAILTKTQNLFCIYSYFGFFPTFLWFGMIWNSGCLACYITLFSGIVLKQSILVALGFVGD